MPLCPPLLQPATICVTNEVKKAKPPLLWDFYMIPPNLCSWGTRFADYSVTPSPKSAELPSLFFKCTFFSPARTLYLVTSALPLGQFLPSFRMKFISTAILPAVPSQPGKLHRQSFTKLCIDLYGHSFSWFCRHSREDGRRCKFHPKRGGAVLSKMSGKCWGGIVILTIEKNCWSEIS